jgi:hypothetical protein
VHSSYSIKKILTCIYNPSGFQQKIWDMPKARKNKRQRGEQAEADSEVPQSIAGFSSINLISCTRKGKI